MVLIAKKSFPNTTRVIDRFHVPNWLQKLYKK
nr:transposase [Flavobacterium frigidarium]